MSCRKDCPEPAQSQLRISRARHCWPRLAGRERGNPQITMAKKTNSQIKAAFMADIEKLYEKHGSKFFDALEESEQKTLTLNFGVTINLKEAAPIITTEVSFKDKTTESGMDVSKTYRATTTNELDDPSQPSLPGADVKGKKGDGKKKNADAEQEGGE